jgi:hypothetical protein
MVLKGGEVSLWYETKVVIPGVHLRDARFPCLNLANRDEAQQE